MKHTTTAGLVLALVLTTAFTLPKPRVQKKHLVAPTPHGATLLMFKPLPAVVVPPPRIYNMPPFHYANTSTWYQLQGSKDLTNWFVLPFTYTNNSMWVTNPPANFFRMKGL